MIFFQYLKSLEMRYGMNYFQNNCMVPVETVETLALDKYEVSFPRCLTGRKETGKLILWLLKLN